MKIYVLKSNYYIGENPPTYVQDNAVLKDVEEPKEGEHIEIDNWEVKYVKDDENES